MKLLLLLTMLLPVVSASADDASPVHDGGGAAELLDTRTPPPPARAGPEILWPTCKDRVRLADGRDGYVCADRVAERKRRALAEGRTVLDGRGVTASGFSAGVGAPGTIFDQALSR